MPTKNVQDALSLIEGTLLARGLCSRYLLTYFFEPLKTNFPSLLVITQTFWVIFADNAVTCLLQSYGCQPRFMDVLCGHSLELWYISPERSVLNNVLLYNRTLLPYYSLSTTEWKASSVATPRTAFMIEC